MSTTHPWAAFNTPTATLPIGASVPMPSGFTGHAPVVTGYLTHTGVKQVLTSGGYGHLTTAQHPTGVTAKQEKALAARRAASKPQRTQAYNSRRKVTFGRNPNGTVGMTPKPTTKSVATTTKSVTTKTNFNGNNTGGTSLGTTHKGSQGYTSGVYPPPGSIIAGTTPTTTTSKKSSSSIWIYAIAGIAIAGGGYLWYRHNKQKQSVTQGMAP